MSQPPFGGQGTKTAQSLRILLPARPIARCRKVHSDPGFACARIPASIHRAMHR